MDGLQGAETRCSWWRVLLKPTFPQIHERFIDFARSVPCTADSSAKSDDIGTDFGNGLQIVEMQTHGQRERHAGSVCPPAPVDKFTDRHSLQQAPPVLVTGVDQDSGSTEFAGEVEELFGIWRRK